MLTRDRWRSLEPLLDQAFDLPTVERPQWLAELAQREPTAAFEVAALLAEEAVAAQGGFLSAPPAVGLEGTELGAYRLERLLGQGGMGTVWLGARCDGRFEGKAAIKLLQLACVSSAGQARFRREGSLLARLQHPAIARLLDAGVSACGQPFLVLEYVDGEPIDSYAERRGLAQPERIHLLLEVLAAVEHAHTRLVIHRDLKPSNILVTREGRVKLLDFGIAKLLGGSAEEGALERDGLLLTAGAPAFTPMYAAPEQVRGDALTTATDVYALGVLLYVLLSGRHPTSEGVQTRQECLRRVLEAEPAPLGLGELDHVLAKALRKDPAERYASAAALADELERHLAHRPVSAGPSSWRYRARKFVRRHRAGVALAAVASVASSGFIGAIVAQGRRAVHEAAEADAQRRRADEATRAATEQRDFALRQLRRAEAVNDLNEFLLTDAAPAGKPFTVGALLARAEQVIDRQYGSDRESHVEMLIAIGRQYDLQDSPRKAREVLVKAHEQSRALPNPAVRAKAACALAKAIAVSGELDHAEALLAMSRAELPSEPRFALDEVFCLLRGAEVAVEAGAPAHAVEQVERAEQRLRESALAAPASLELGLAIQRADVLRLAGRFGPALEAFALAWSKLEALGRGDTENASTLLNQWGLTAFQSGQPLVAERSFRRAIHIETVATNPDTPSPVLLSNLARALVALARYDEADAHARRAIEIGRRLGHEIVVSQTLLTRVSLQRQAGRFEPAAATLAVLEKRLAAQNLPREHIAFGATALERGLLALERGRHELAQASLDRAVSVAERDGQPPEYLPRFLLARSLASQRLGRLDQAESDARRAHAIERELIEDGGVSCRLGRSAFRLASVLLARSGRGGRPGAGGSEGADGSPEGDEVSSEGGEVSSQGAAGSSEGAGVSEGAAGSSEGAGVSEGGTPVSEGAAFSEAAGLGALSELRELARLAVDQLEATLGHDHPEVLEARRLVERSSSAVTGSARTISAATAPAQSPRALVLPRNSY